MSTRSIVRWSTAAVVIAGCARSASVPDGGDTMLPDAPDARDATIPVRDTGREIGTPDAIDVARPALDVEKSDIDEIVEEHLKNGRIVERLTL